MEGIGVLFAVDEPVVNKLRSIKTALRAEYISEEIEELYFEEYPERTAELDTAWDAMHRALTDGTLCFDCTDQPLGMAILGGELLYFDGVKYTDHIITVKNPGEVKAVYEGLSALSEKEIKKGYDKIDPEEYGDKSKADLEYMLEYLEDSIPFWKFAAEKGLWVIFSV